MMQRIRHLRSSAVSAVNRRKSTPIMIHGLILNVKLIGQLIAQSKSICRLYIFVNCHAAETDAVPNPGAKVAETVN